MISAVAEMYGIHPQTLRLYEREGLLKPSRSDGNTRLYTDGDLERLEVILKLTRDLGVNLAGVEIIHEGAVSTADGRGVRLKSRPAYYPHENRPILPLSRKMDNSNVTTRGNLTASRL